MTYHEAEQARMDAHESHRREWTDESYARWMAAILVSRNMRLAEAERERLARSDQHWTVAR